MTFLQRMKPYLELASTKEERRILDRAVSHMVVFNDHVAYCKIIKPLPKEISTIFYFEVREVLRSSFEARKLWRTVRFNSSNKCSLAESASKFGADADDAKFIRRSLTPTDFRQLSKEVSEEDDYGFLPQKDFNAIVANLSKYCNRVAYLKLRFLSDNDRLFDPEDLSSELLARGIRIVRVYEHCGEIAKITNYAKRGISNHALNLIQFHTSASRARVLNTTQGCSTCIFCLTGRPQRCPHAVANYQAVVVSISSEESVRAIPDSSDRNMFSSAQGDSFVSFMKKGLSPDSGQVMKLLLSTEPQPRFEAYLQDKYGYTSDFLSDNPQRLVRLFCEYLDVPHEKVTQDLHERYSLYQKA